MKRKTNLQIAEVVGLFAMILLVLPVSSMAINSVQYPQYIKVDLERPDSISLNGMWQFKTDPDEMGEKENWSQPGKINERTVRVPLPWQLADEELIPYRGTAWYERQFEIPASYRGKRITLNFHGVDNNAKVWVNGEYVGGHEGAQPPFQLDITDAAKVGESNTVTVEVNDPPSGTSFFMDTHSLIGVSGIWRDVWISPTGNDFISDVFMIPDYDNASSTAQVTVYVAPTDAEKVFNINVEATGPNGKSYRTTETFQVGANSKGRFIVRKLDMPMRGFQEWNLDEPNLYEVEASLTSEDGESLDEAGTHFGMRKLHTEEGRIFLNNRPLYIVGGGLDPGPFGGAVDVNWHLPPPYEYPDDEQIQEDIRKTKYLGVNFVRVPLRPMHPRFSYWADRMGLLVMQGGPWTPTEGIQAAGGFDEYVDSWTKIVLRDRNHPSVALWELFNESFGIGPQEFKVISGRLYDHIKSIDPTRFILDNAGGAYLNELNYIGNHGKTDIEDVHSYPGFPMFFFAEGSEIRYPAIARDQWTEIRWREDPVLVTEFAPAPYVYNVAKIRRKWNGEEPWWFNARQVQSAMPAQWDLIGFEDRFDRWRFDDLVYGDFDKFTAKSDWNYFWGLKYYTQMMRINPELSGYVCWLFDSAPHPVGSIDFFKDIKVYGDELAKIWTQDLVVIDETRHNYWEGERVYADVHVSHFSQEDLKNGRIEWWLEGTDIQGTIEGVSLNPAEVDLVGRIRFELPAVQQSEMKKLYAQLVTRRGEVLSENFERIFCYPLKYRQPNRDGVAYHGLEGHRLAVLGYELLPLNPNVTKVAVVHHMSFDENVKRFLNRGGTAIVLLCEHPDYWERNTLPRILPFEELLEQNDMFYGRKFQGGHSDSFYARKNLGIFDRIPFDNPYTFEFAAIWPRRVLGGIKHEVAPDVLAGAYGNLFRSIPRDSMANTSWEEVSGTLMQFKVGDGRLLISTFNLLLPLLDDPAAAVLLHDLIEYGHSDFEPKTEFKLD